MNRLEIVIRHVSLMKQNKKLINFLKEVKYQILTFYTKN
jgi:hypothetical protein